MRPAPALVVPLLALLVLLAPSARAQSYDELNRKVLSLASFVQAGRGADGLSRSLAEAPPADVSVLDELAALEALRADTTAGVDAQSLNALIISTSTLFQSVARGGTPDNATSAGKRREADLLRLMPFVLAVSANTTQYAANLYREQGAQIRADPMRAKGVRQISTGMGQTLNGTTTALTEAGSKAADLMPIAARLRKDLPLLTPLLGQADRARAIATLERAVQRWLADTQLAFTLRQIQDGLAAAPPPLDLLQ